MVVDGTSTPEHWDDVGSLRLQVDCISLQVHDVQKERAGTETQIQKLQSLLYQQQKDMCYMKICLVAVSALLVSCFGVLLCMYAVNVNAVAAVRLDTTSISSDTIDSKLPLQSLDFQNISEEDFTHALANGLSSGDLQGQQETNSTKGDKKDVLPAVPASEVQESNDSSNQTEVFHLPLPSQEFEASVVNKGLRGTFWICFAPHQFDQNVASFSDVFDSLTEQWSQASFVFLDTQKLAGIHERLEGTHDNRHLCGSIWLPDAQGNTTFVAPQLPQRCRTCSRIKWIGDSTLKDVKEYGTHKEIALIAQILQDATNKAGTSKEDLVVPKGDLRL